MSKFIVGLTGGIGSGKTTVANYFASLGIELIDADIVARQVVEPKSVALKQISAHFGEDFLLADGNLDRAKLRTKIFADSQEKDWLNQLLHPIIRTELLKQLQLAQSSYCILVAPLLIENSLTQYVDKTLVVDIPVELQLARTMERDNNNKEQVQNIINNQISRGERLKAADDVIDNSSKDLIKIEQQVQKLHQRYLNLAQ